MFITFRIKWLRRAAALLLLFALLGFSLKGVLSPKETVPALASLRPQALTVIIDPGHGGADGGASSSDGVLESALNLEISQRLEALLLFFGLPVRMTRSSDSIDYPPEANSIRAKKNADTRARVQLIESTDNALLISIHQNYYPSAGPRGTQVLYAPTEDSQALAKQMQANILTHIDPENRRRAAPVQNSVYIMNHVSCPAVLVECGFLSNPEELANLRTPAYQLKLAAVLAASILPSGGNYEG